MTAAGTVNGKIANEIKIAHQRSNHCKENSPSWLAAECPISHSRVPHRGSFLTTFSPWSRHSRTAVARQPILDAR
jgi:hypothetical protein